MDEKLFNLLENDIKGVLSRFGVDTNLIQNINGFKSLPISMTPRLFKDIWIEGGISQEKEGNHLNVYVKLAYRYKSFCGGSNGIDICTICYYVDNNYAADCEREDVEPEDLRYLFKRRYVLM